MSDRLYFFDTTLRDGEQVPGCQLNTVEKIQLAKQLEALGVDVIEAGLMAASITRARYSFSVRPASSA